jgi:hypothetical protein
MAHTWLKSDVFPLLLGPKFGCSSPGFPRLRLEFPLLHAVRNFGSKLLKTPVFLFHITHGLSTKLQIPLHFARARLSRIVSGYRERRRRDSRLSIGHRHRHAHLVQNVAHDAAAVDNHGLPRMCHDHQKLAGSLRTVRGLPRRDAMRSWVRVAPGGGPHVLLDPPAAPGPCRRGRGHRFAAERKNYDAQAEGAELEFPRGSIVGEATDLAYSRSRPSIPQSRRDRCQGSGLWVHLKQQNVVNIWLTLPLSALFQAI